MLRGQWHIIVLREHSGISAGILFGWPQVVVDWERVTEETKLFPVYTIHLYYAILEILMNLLHASEPEAKPTFHSQRWDLIRLQKAACKPPF